MCVNSPHDRVSCPSKALPLLALEVVLGSREICPEPQCNPKLQRRSPEPQSGLEDQAPEVRA